MTGPSDAVPGPRAGALAGRRSRQPWLHQLQTAVHGPVTALSHATGDIDVDAVDGAATGLYVDDRRILSRLVLEVDGMRPVGVVAASEGSTTECLLIARNVGDPGPDPTVEVRRHRSLTDVGLEETVSITSRAGSTVRCRVTMSAQGDGAELHEVKVGTADRPALPVRVDDDRGGWVDERHSDPSHRAGCRALRRRDPVLSPAGRWRFPTGARRPSGSRFGPPRIVDTPFNPTPGAGRVGWSAVRVTSRDARLGTTVAHSLTDLEHLLLADPEDPRDVFAAAGSPWYLTLFGRDSIWAARMTLPFGTDLARGTLRALARRQGRRDDPSAAEQPGKILHELRRTTFVDPGVFELPPTYYGTVDATPLWVCLLHDAWRWGLPARDVIALRPALDGALGWLRRSAEEGGGLVRYHDPTGNGLSNQGWKDSGDAMRTARGTIAAGPIALVETQAYAVEAALGAADLLEVVLDADGTAWRTWAAELAQRVRQLFWVTREDGRRYLAMAVDGTGALVDGIGSNMGHVLGSGPARPVGDGRRRGRPRRIRDALSARPADAVEQQPGIQPAGVPHRVDLDPRHGDLRLRAGPHRPHRGGVPPGRGARRRRRRERLPVARALRRRARARHARSLPGELPAPGVGRRVRGPARLDRPRPTCGRTERRRRGGTPAREPVRGRPRRGHPGGGRSLAVAVDGAGRVVDVDAEAGLEVRVRTGPAG